MCHLAQYEYGSRIPKPRYEVKQSTWAVGIRESVRILGKTTQFSQNIFSLYYSTGSWNSFHTFVQQLAFCVRSWVAVESAGLLPDAPHTAQYYLNIYY